MTGGLARGLRGLTGGLTAGLGGLGPGTTHRLSGMSVKPSGLPPFCTFIGVSNYVVGQSTVAVPAGTRIGDVVISETSAGDVAAPSVWNNIPVPGYAYDSQHFLEHLRWKFVTADDIANGFAFQGSGYISQWAVYRTNCKGIRAVSFRSQASIPSQLVLPGWTRRPDAVRHAFFWTCRDPITSFSSTYTLGVGGHVLRNTYSGGPFSFGQVVSDAPASSYTDGVAVGFSKFPNSSTLGGGVVAVEFSKR